jgi:hypothetical protein
VGVSNRIIVASATRAKDLQCSGKLLRRSVFWKSSGALAVAALVLQATSAVAAPARAKTASSLTRLGLSARVSHAGTDRSRQTARAGRCIGTAIRDSTTGAGMAAFAHAGPGHRSAMHGTAVARSLVCMVCVTRCPALWGNPVSSYATAALSERATGPGARCLMLRSRHRFALLHRTLCLGLPSKPASLTLPNI